MDNHELDSHIKTTTLLLPKVEQRCAAALAGVGLFAADTTAIITGIEAGLRHLGPGEHYDAEMVTRALRSGAIERAVTAALVVDGEGSWWAVRNERFSAAMRSIDEVGQERR